MILLIVSIGLVAFTIIHRESKFVSALLMIWLWILYAWSSGTADFSVYVNRYNLYLTRISYTEPLYTLIVKAFQALGADFRLFLILTVLISYVLIYYTAVKITPNIGIVIGLYAIFPFVMDVTIMRYFLASSIIIFGFRYLINFYNDHQRKNLIIWLIAVFLATMTHYSCVVFLLLIIPRWISVRQTIFCTVGLVILLYLVTNQSTVRFVVSLFNSEKALMVTANETNKQMLNTIRIILIFIEFIVLWMLYNRRPASSNALLHNGLKKAILPINIILLSTIPLTMVIPDVVRIQATLSFLNYLFFSTYYRKKIKGKANGKQVLYSILLILAALINLYLLVLRSENINNVFWPVFNNNVLFK